MYLSPEKSYHAFPNLEGAFAQGLHGMSDRVAMDKRVVSGLQIRFNIFLSLRSTRAYFAMALG